MDLRPVAESLVSGVWPETKKMGLICSDETDACGEWYHPLWLAQVIVGWVEERAKLLHTDSAHDELQHLSDPNYGKGWEEYISEALHDFNLTPDLWQWLKARIMATVEK